MPAKALLFSVALLMISEILFHVIAQRSARGWPAPATPAPVAQ